METDNKNEQKSGSKEVKSYPIEFKVYLALAGCSVAWIAYRWYNGKSVF